jgi:two-component system alkaline phosphatase synthesis response regulator PhoP
MAKERVLVVDDERDILELVKYNLSKDGFSVTCVQTGEDALRESRTKPPGIIVLDLMLPGLDGLEVCRILKNDAKTQHIPILILSAKGEESDVVAGLELGAADYVTKPFSPRVLLARVRAVLRREREGGVVSTPIELGGIAIHPGRFEVLVQGQPVDLTASEFRILHFLARKPGWVFTRQQIVDAAQGEDSYLSERFVTDRSVDVHMVSLRRKLGSAGTLVETVRGVGYRIKEA